MSNVYIKRMSVLDDSVNDVVYNALSKIIEKEKIKLSGVVPLKIHFGEKGNITYIKPNYFDGIKRYLKENDLETCYIDTNVLYKGSRTITKDHIKTAIEHGFDDLPIVIADGEDNKMYNEIPVGLKHYSKCKIGFKYKDYDNFIIISHFKGHGLAGFGGAIKQLSMGFASRGGKLHMHYSSVPSIDEDLCVGCSICSKNCPVDAIVMDKKANIIEEKCIGCAGCSALCPVSAVVNNTKSTDFHEKLAEYAYAATLNKTNIYIQYAFNITQRCDCCGAAMKPIADDIGVFISTDPVAIDKAALDIFRSENDTELFDAGLATLKYASEIGLGSIEYKLVDLQ